jgi:hypothetical protein
VGVSYNNGWTWLVLLGLAVFLVAYVGIHSWIDNRRAK